MRKYRLFLILCIVAILCSVVTIMVYSFYVIEEIKTIDMYLKVDDYVGINVDTDALHFGTVSPGGSGTRSVFLSNNYGKSLKVEIKVYGDLAEFVSVEKSLVLSKNETKKISFTASIPKNALYGNYTGRAVFILKKI